MSEIIKYEKIKEYIKNSLAVKIIMFFLCVNVFIIGGIFLYFHNNLNDTNDNYEYENIEGMLETDNTKTEKIIVYVIGEINNVGVYELEPNSRIADLIEMAGGVTENADLNKINLAYQLEDGEKIKIPSIEEELNGNNIVEEEYFENNSKDTKININTADISKLVTIPGVGESTAQKIISYRDQNGKFSNIEDIKNVSGIGESKYNQIKDYIKTK